MARFEISTVGGQRLALITAETPEAAKLALIAERGYGYYNPESLSAVELPPVQHVDYLGNPTSVGDDLLWGLLEACALPSFPDGLPQQLEDRGSDSWCSLHGRIPWAMDGICGACECAMDEQDAIDAERGSDPEDRPMYRREWESAELTDDEDDCLF